MDQPRIEQLAPSPTAVWAAFDKSRPDGTTGRHYMRVWAWTLTADPQEVVALVGGWGELQIMSTSYDSQDFGDEGSCRLSFLDFTSQPMDGGSRDDRN